MVTRLIFFLSSIIAFLVCGTAIAQKQWVPAGTPGFSTGITAYGTMAVSKNNVKYIAYLDGPAGAKTTVMKYDGTNWQLVGNAGFSNSIVNNVVIALDTGDVPYIAYQDQSNNARATVMKYDGSNWVKVGLGFSTGQAMDISLVFDKNNTPYVSYRDVSASFNVTVMKYNGTAWVPVGPVGFSTGGANIVSLAIDNSNTPYIAYDDIPGGGKVIMMKYNGTNWVAVNTSSVPIISANNIFLAFDANNTLYLAVNDGAQSGAGAVMKYNGTQWIMVGSMPSIGIASFALDNNGVPYVGYKDHLNAAKASVLRYDGTNWTALGNAGFSSGDFLYMGMVVDKTNMPFVSYTDRVLNDQMTVMKFDCPDEMKAAICAVTTDTATGANVIVWNTVAHVDSYRVFREDNGSYTHIGTVAGGSRHFVDANANTAVQSYKYKITLLDSCEREMHIDSSVAHKTIRLGLVSLQASAATIGWNQYEGIDGLVYTVKRSNNGGSYTTIASFGISGSDTTYVDASIPLGDNSYRIDVALANPCSAGSLTYDRITSNTITVKFTGINDITVQNISLLPNPGTKEVKISMAQDLMKVAIYDLTGRRLMTTDGNGKKELVVDISCLPSGVYLLRVNDMHNARFIKQ